MIAGASVNYSIVGSSYDDVAFYDSTLLASDVERLYAEGLPTHTLADAKK
jgi:hypothetical protein